jgi:hypothetical protein
MTPPKTCCLYEVKEYPLRLGIALRISYWLCLTARGALPAVWDAEKETEPGTGRVLELGPQLQLARSC